MSRNWSKLGGGWLEQRHRLPLFNGGVRVIFSHDSAAKINKITASKEVATKRLAQAARQERSAVDKQAGRLKIPLRAFCRFYIP